MFEERMTKETKAEGGQEGQNGGIAIGTGHAKADEISLNGVKVKSTDPGYKELRESIMQSVMKRVGLFK
jgi:hypothetical protein